MADVELPTERRDSVEKVHAVVDSLWQAEAEDEETAQLLAILKMAAPMLRNFLPDDPERLDEVLLLGARWALSLRSDDAPQPAGAIELLEQEEEDEAEAAE